MPSPYNRETVNFIETAESMEINYGWNNLEKRKVLKCARKYGRETVSLLLIFVVIIFSWFHNLQYGSRV